jgi:hypothetical protein
LALERDNKFITNGREINWDDKSILSSDPRTKEIELQVQKIIELQQIASNLPNVFIDYKCITKFLNSTVNVPCRVEVPIKTTPPPKRGRASQQKDASNKRPKNTRKTSSSKKVNASQPKVDGHQVDMINSLPSPHVRTTEQAGGSEDPDSLILGNHDEFHGVQKMSINYTNSRELLDHTTTVVNSYFFQPWFPGRQLPCRHITLVCPPVEPSRLPLPRHLVRTSYMYKRKKGMIEK